MTRRQALQTMLAGSTLPAVAVMARPYEPPDAAEESEGEYAVSSLMAILLDLTDDEFHAKPAAHREMLMGALYEVLNQDDQAVALWARSIAARDKQALTDLYDFLKARAQVWDAALERNP